MVLLLRQGGPPGMTEAERRKLSSDRAAWLTKGEK